jgi:calcineurin-like phosphoesterase
MKYFFALVFLASLFTSFIAEATPASDALLGKYKYEGASNFDIERGKKYWHTEVKNKDNDILSCGTCHGSDLGKSGKHRTTNKIIEPMAASVNKERFTDEKKMEKWFKRNCNDTWGRECTAQEKGDILKYLLSL